MAAASSSGRARSLAIASLAILNLATLILAKATNAQPNINGQWTVVDTTKWFTGATHMGLLRGKADSSFVLFWNDNNDFDPHL